MSEYPPVVPPAEAPTGAVVDDLGGIASDEEIYKLVLIDQTRDARDEARDLADKQLTEELNQGSRFQRIVKSVWKGNLLRDYYRVKYTQQHEAAIAESGNVLQAESLPEAQTRAINATIDRFQNGDDELIHTEAGEKRDVHTDDALATSLKALIRDYANGTLNETTLEQEKKKVLEAYGKDNPDADLSKSLVLTDNLREIAQSIKGRFTQDEAMERAIANMEIITGEARNGARTEAQYSRVDKIVDSWSKTKAGSLVTPGALATGVALTFAVVGVGTKSVLGAAAATAGLGTIAGAWAGLRENKRVKDERSQHSREMAAGGEVAEGDKRREAMEATRYETVSAITLEQALREKTSEEALAAGEAQADAVRAALNALVEAQARVNLSDEKNIDLISYSSKADVGEERTKLDLARVESRRALEAALTSELRAQLNIHDDLSLKDIIAGRIKATENEYEAEMSDKDKAFRALKRRRVAGAVAAGTLTGLAGGLVAQEVIAGLDPAREGLFEALSGTSTLINADGDVHQTILAGFVNGEETLGHVAAEGEAHPGATGADAGEGAKTFAKATDAFEHHEPSTTFDQYDTSADTDSFVKVGDDMEWKQQPDGSYTIIGPDGKTAVEGIVINPDGSIDQATLDRIDVAGLTVEDNSTPELVEKEVPRDVPLDQRWQELAPSMQATSIDTWYGNDSPHSDLNELRMYRGGEGGMVDGGFRFESGMTPNGSFVNGESVNPVAAAQQGDVAWVISRAGEDSGQMLVMPSNPDGSINISENDPAAAFISNQNGQAEVAEGYRLHTAVVEGVNEDGSLRIGSLATIEGEAQVGSATITEVQNVEVTHHEYIISSEGYNAEVVPGEGGIGAENGVEAGVGAIPGDGGDNDAGADAVPFMEGYNTMADTFTEVAPITPVVGRRSMENIGSATANEKAPRSGYYNGELSESAAERIRQASSPRLQENPDAELNAKQELAWFHQDLIKRKGAEYVADLDAFVQNDPVLKNISAETSSIVTIPVKASGESENIYGTLALYAQQEPVNGDKITILMNVNWLDTNHDNPDEWAAVQKTIAEIERAKIDFPNLAIATMQKEYNKEETGRTGGAIGYIAGDLMNAALLAVNGKIARGEMADDHDVLIVRSDADLDGVARTQLRNFEKAAAENKDLDILKGATRFGVADYEKFPGFGISAAFSTMMSVASSQESIHTGGANFAARASTLAAVAGLGEYLDDEGNLYTGAGSDDVFLGRRIRAARRMDGSAGSASYYSGGYSNTSASAARTKQRSKLVAGAAIDTNGQRSLAYYVEGLPIMDVWNPEQEGSFSDDPTGHRDRAKDAELVREAPKDDVDQDTLYKSIELNIQNEIRWASKAVAKKTLGLFFAGVSGGYTIEGQYGGGGDTITFKLTPAGRAFIKKRIQREMNGRYGSYSLRKQRQLYGITRPGAKRQPAGARSPLVSRLA